MTEISARAKHFKETKRQEDNNGIVIKNQLKSVFGDECLVTTYLHQNSRPFEPRGDPRYA